MTSPEQDAQIRRQADQAVTLVNRLKDVLGPGFPDGIPGDAGFNYTAKGRCILHVGPLRFQEDDKGALYSWRATGGRAHVVWLEHDGNVGATTIGAGDPADN